MQTRTAIVAALILMAPVGIGTALGGEPAAIVIRNVTLVSPERGAPLPNTDVLIRDARIAKIGRALPFEPGAVRIDGRGRFLIPGLIDSHVHVGYSAALDDNAIDARPDLWAAYKAHLPKAYLAFGFTTVVDLDDGEAALRAFEALSLRPRFIHCGRGVKIAGGYGAQRLPAPDTPNFPNLVYEPAATKNWPTGLKAEDFTPARAVERAAKAGARCLKAFVEPGFGGAFDWPVPSVTTLRALKEQAHSLALPFFVHANSLDAWRTAVDGRADIIAHGMWFWPGDLADATAPAAVRAAIGDAAMQGIRVQPTLQVLMGEQAILDWGILDDPRLALSLPRSVVAYLKSSEGQAGLRKLAEGYSKGVPQPGFRALLAAVIARTKTAFRLMLDAKVPLIFGSDTPSGDGIGNPPGLNGRLELQAWADAGAPLDLILRAATLDNAKAIGQAHDLGSIEVGKRADLVLLKANPLESVSAYDAIETVILDGKAIARDSLAPSD